MMALSVRQPYAWLIVNGWKPIENRSWPAPPEMIGRWIQIHAAKKMTVAEWGEALRFALKAGCTMLPKYEQMKFGGIIGVARLVRCVRVCSSPWFTGRYGFVLQDPYPLPFVPCPGQLGFFDPLSAPKWAARTTEDLG